MSRNARTPAPRRRRLALSFGMAAGAACIAASFSMGNAPVARADVLGAATVSDLSGALDSHAVAAAGVSDALALSYLIEAFDPNSFSAAGTPTDALGLLGYDLDTFLLGPTGIDAELTPLVLQLVGSGVGVTNPATDADPLSDLVGAFDPNSFSSTGAPTDVLGFLAYGLDTYLLGPSGIGDALDPLVDSDLASVTANAASVDVAPISDLVGALDPSAVSAGLADLTAPTAAGLLDSVMDGLLNSGLSLF